MRYLVFLVIHLYWKIVPRGKRRHCIFKQSCSKHVYEITKTKGFLAGLSAFKRRYVQCRTGYKVYFNSAENRVEVELADGTITHQNEINPELLKNFF